MVARRVFQDFLILAASILLALAIVHYQIVQNALAYTNDFGLSASFISGIFFTSIFTAAPATVVLGELSIDTSLFVVVFAGALGSVLGDYVMYVFIRNRLLQDASQILKRSRLHQLLHILKSRRYHRVMQLVGVILLVSPLPDEPALAMLGLSSISSRNFFLLSFTTHAAGILVIALSARSLAG